MFEIFVNGEGIIENDFMARAGEFYESFIAVSLKCGGRCNAKTFHGLAPINPFLGRDIMLFAQSLHDLFNKFMERFFFKTNDIHRLNVEKRAIIKKLEMNFLIITIPLENQGGLRNWQRGQCVY